MALTVLLLIGAAIACQAGDDIFPPPAEYRHDFKITQTYDKFKDETWLKMDYGGVWKNPDNEVELDLYTTFKGDGRSEPHGMPVFHFVNEGRDGWRYLKNHEVTFLADEERMSFREHYDGSVGKGYVLEFIAVYPSQAQLKKILHSRKVQFRIGFDELELTESHLNALKEYCSYIGSPHLRVSSPEIRKKLQAARALESRGEDEQASSAYKLLVETAPGTHAAAEANDGIKRLDEPARKEAYKKRAAERAKAAAVRADAERAKDWLRERSEERSV